MSPFVTVPKWAGRKSMPFVLYEVEVSTASGFKFGGKWHIGDLAARGLKNGASNHVFRWLTGSDRLSGSQSAGIDHEQETHHLHRECPIHLSLLYMCQ